jgi:hypothetical protein
VWPAVTELDWCGDWALSIRMVEREENERLHGELASHQRLTIGHVYVESAQYAAEAAERDRLREERDALLTVCRPILDNGHIEIAEEYVIVSLSVEEWQAVRDTIARVERR